MNTSAPILANRHARGENKLVLVDPYVPHGRHYADEWVAPKPGTDAAMVMDMIRWILDHPSLRSPVPRKHDHRRGQR